MGSLGGLGQMGGRPRARVGVEAEQFWLRERDFVARALWRFELMWLGWLELCKILDGVLKLCRKELMLCWEVGSLRERFDEDNVDDCL